ncbi:hypothetical protein H6A18_09320 [Collinsella tanakaei]|uniref:phage tail protein n=1 Tax=Collinsella tanakaei TaxID=626935 RepID=UPI00195D1354|nr:hypothetical protein [Collinsella tanakaei]MBM6756701.1 hypothetical protein [Collinsella tanakaei]
MAGKQMQAVISLVGKVDSSLKSAIDSVEKQMNKLAKTKAIKSGLSKVGSGIATGAKALAAAGATVAGAGASAALAVGSAALQQYATYEQMVGGVETLFGAGGKNLDEYAASIGKSASEAQAQYDKLMASQQAVFDNAASAYKTAGVSANQYMEQATAFSASLIQSLGGDTQAAASYADLAIKDMSDNANKMGTSIESIQQTYQSLMRGNYAMLDNLKLGYGGTKSELERLVKDANEYKESIGEVGDLSSDSFADVIQAINAIQRKMGITGATAAEAMGTIQGSVNMAKAAWDNWLSGLGTEGADMGQLTSQLVESIGAVADNVGPAVQRIGSALASQLPSAISGAVSTVGPVLAEALAGVMNSVGSVFGLDLNVDASGIISMFQSIATALQPIIDGIGSTLGAVLPSVVSGFQQLAASVGPALSVFTTSAPFVTTLGQALSNLATAVLPPLMSVIGSILPLLASIANAILPPIISFITPIASLLMNLAAAVIPPLTAAIQFLTPVIQFLVSAVMTLIPIFSGLMGVINALTAPITSIGAVLLPQMSAAFGFLQGPLNAAIGIFNAVVGALTPIVSTLGSIISLAGQAASAIASIGGGIIGGIGSFLGFARGGFTSGPYIAGEDPRYPNEAVISFNPAYRAQNLRYWAMAGHMLGASPARAASVSGGGGGGSTTYDFSGMTFAPRVEVRGNASKADIIAAIKECELEFVDTIRDMLARDEEDSYAAA